MRYLIAETTWGLMNLAQDLSKAGVLLTRTDRPEDIPHFLHASAADLLILDETALTSDGLTLSLLRRARPGMPIALFADDPTPEQVVKWLGAGADTVITSDSSPEETIMILAAMARRAHGLARPTLGYGPLRIDLHRRKAYLNDCPIKLSPKVYELLEYMALRPRRLLSRPALLSHIYGLEDEPDARVFDVYVCNLRACLQATEGAIDIETVRGAGYRFSAADDGGAIAA